MKEEEIKANIDQSVQVFRQCLENTYLKNNKAFYGVGYFPLMEFFTGKISLTRKSNGALKISGDIPKAAFSEKLTGLPRSFEDWNIFPVVFTLFNVPPSNQSEFENPKENSK